MVSPRLSSAFLRSTRLPSSAPSVTTKPQELVPELAWKNPTGTNSIPIPELPMPSNESRATAAAERSGSNETQRQEVARRQSPFRMVSTVTSSTESSRRRNAVRDDGVRSASYPQDAEAIAGLELPAPRSVLERSATSPSDRNPVATAAPLGANRPNAVPNQPESASRLGIGSTAPTQSAVPLPNPETNENPKLRREILIRAARNAVSLKNYPTALARFEELLLEFPMAHDAREEYAGILAAVGRLKDAQQQYAQLITLDEVNIDYKLQLANVLIQDNQHANAESLLRQVIDQGTDDDEVYVMLARILAWQNKLDEATSIYEQRIAPAVASGMGTNSANIARLLLEIRRPAEALRMINGLLRFTPMDAELNLDRILATIRLGDESTAHRLIAESKQILSISDEQRIQLGDTFYSEGYYRHALALFQQAAEAPGDNIIAQTKVVRTNVQLYDMTAARAALEMLAPFADHRAVRLETANYMIAIGEHAEAHAILRELLAIDANDAQAIQSIGELFFAVGDYQRAELEFGRALELNRANSQLKTIIARVIAKQLRGQEALSYLRAENTVGTSQSLPVDLNLASEAVNLLTRANAPEQAAGLARSALKQTVDPAAVTNLRTSLGFALLKQGKTSEALFAFENASKGTGGDSPEIRYGLFRCLKRTGRHAEAMELLHSELNSFGPQTWERVRIANLASQDCDYDLAVMVLNQALMFDPDNIYLMVRLAEVTSESNRCQGGCTDRQFYHQALSYSPTNTRATLGLARSYARTNDFDPSRSSYLRILNHFPYHDPARIEHARLTYAWEGVDAANAEYAKAEGTHDPTRFLPQNSGEYLALQDLEVGYHQASSKKRRISHERNGKYWREWRPSTALASFHNLLSVEPTNQEAHFDLAQTYSLLHQTERAIQQYNQLLAIEPCHVEAQIARYRMYLETRPQLRNRFDFEHRAGREGLTNITLFRAESVAVRPYGDEDEYFSIGYAHRFLKPHRGPDTDGNVGIFGLHTKPLDQLNLYSVVELEAYNNGIRTRPTFQTGAKWRTGEDAEFHLRGFLENVIENGESIRQDIYRGGFDLTYTKYFHWRWLFQGMYRYASYSDFNSLHELMIQNDITLRPGRSQLHALLDFNLMSFDQQTQFGNPDDLFGTVHPYFTPTGFTFLTAGLKHRFWVSDHSFRGANEHWYSIYGGARVDSDAEGYALVELAAHRDWCGWLTAHADASAIFSDVYQGIAFSGFLTIRFP